jgi:hypothetical protein
VITADPGCPPGHRQHIDADRGGQLEPVAAGHQRAAVEPADLPQRRTQTGQRPAFRRLRPEDPGRHGPGHTTPEGEQCDQSLRAEHRSRGRTVVHQQEAVQEHGIDDF